MRGPTIRVRQVVLAGVAFTALIVAETVGYVLILGASVVEALVRAVSTVYTAGLVAAPESTAAKIFTLVLVVGGVAIFLYVLGLVIELVVRGAVTVADVATTSAGPHFRFEEMEATEASRQAGKSIRDLNIRKDTRALIVPLRKKDRAFDTTPTPVAGRDVDEIIIAAGGTHGLHGVEQPVASRQALAA